MKLVFLTKMNMRKFFGIICVTMALLLLACGGSDQSDHPFVGTFTDKYNNKFELRPDYTATIQFEGMAPIETTWSDGEQHDRDWASILYNGNPQYYLLRGGKLYHRMEDMQEGRAAIAITYED